MKKKAFPSVQSVIWCKSLLEAAPGISSQVGSAHPTRLLTSILNLVSYTLENFQGGLCFLSGGLRPPQPTPGAATSLYHVYLHMNSIQF